MKTYRADLHIHSCLSPCGELEMSPRAIVERSLEQGLDIIALCDHNSAENTGAAVKAGEEKGLFVFPGMEINSVEEIHTLALFETEEQALAMQGAVYAVLEGENRPRVFGDQVAVNERDEVEGFNDRLLIGSAKMDIHTLVEKIHALGGLAIASHVDRPSYSILSQLGYIPKDLALDALELSRDAPLDFLKSVRGLTGGTGVVRSSDAHRLEDLGTAVSIFHMEGPALRELKYAFTNYEGRSVEVI